MKPIPLICLFWAWTVFAGDVYQIYYSDKKISEKKRLEMEKIYGAKLIVLPYNGTPPEKPLLVEGVVIHSDPVEDPPWVMGTSNPVYEIQEINAKLSDRWEGEATLLKTYAPELYPYTELASHYLDTSSVEVPDDVKERASLLEKLRQQMIKEQGKAILKSRTGFDSAGFLPKTNENWEEMYLEYARSGERDKIKKLEAQYKDPALLQHKIWESDWDNLAMRFLDQMLDNPGNVLVQTMYPADKEFRVHLVQGKLLRTATFNRFDELGKYVSDAEIKAVEDAVEEKFLKNLPPDLKNLSATMDLITGKDGGMKIIDLNAGMESGFYDACEDIYVSNLLAEYFSGQPTPYLTALRDFEQAPFPKKFEKMKKVLKTFGEWIFDWEPSGFWERVIKAYLRDLAQNPTPQRYDRILTALKEAGLRDTWLFHNLNAQVNDLFPQAVLGPANAKKWQKFWSRIADDDEYSYLEGRKIRVLPEGDYDDSAVVKRAAAKILSNESFAKLDQMKFRQIVKHLREGTLKNFYSLGRLKAGDVPSIAWAESEKDLKKDDQAIFYQEESFRLLVKKALRKAGFYSPKKRKMVIATGSTSCLLRILEGLE